jgi:hypothetical protein
MKKLVMIINCCKNSFYINGFLWDKEEPDISRYFQTQPAACQCSLYGPPTTNGARYKQIDVVKCTLLLFSNSDIGTV